MSDLQLQILTEVQTLNRTVGGLQAEQVGLRRDLEHQSREFDEFRRLIAERHKERKAELDRIVADFDANTGMLTKKVDEVAVRVGECPMHRIGAPARSEEAEARTGLWRTLAKVVAGLGAAVSGWFLGKQ